jgi:hypothetical protein
VGVFIKVTKSGPRRYVQLVESFRENGRVKQRTLASLGRLERIAPEVESIVSGLRRLVSGQEKAEAIDPALVDFAPARALGDVWTLDALWRSFGLDRLDDVFRRQGSRRRTAVEAMLRVMVFNRLCDPASKLGILRWLEATSVPGIDSGSVRHQHLLRAMDALIEHHGEVDELVAELLLPRLDTELSAVFYDLTTIRAEGLSEQEGDVRRHGMSKDGGIRRQFVLGVVQTGEGLPLHHEVHEGNVAEVGTLKGTLERVMGRFPIRRVIAIADRGLMSADNLAELSAMTTPSGTPLEYVLAVPGRRYGDFVELVAPLQSERFEEATTETVGELGWNGRRLIVAHDPERAAERTAKRRETIAALEAQASEWVGKLEGQDRGKRARGRPLSDGGVRAKFYHAVLEARLGNIIRVDLEGERFSYSIDEKAMRLAELMDGKLLLATNVTDLAAEEIVERYKALADIERGFRVLKSEIEIGPVHHRLPDRIRAHASICFLALILHRLMRSKLRAAKSALSPERAIDLLGRIQHHQVKLGGRLHEGVTTLTDEQSELLDVLGAEKPALA